MTDARLLQDSKLLLAWSAALEYEAVTFDEWLDRLRDDDYQTEGSLNDRLGTFRSCADDAGHSVRVAEGTL